MKVTIAFDDVPAGVLMQLLRVAGGLTQLGMTQRIGVSQAQLSRLEKGTAEPSAEELALALKACEPMATITLG